MMAEQNTLDKINSWASDKYGSAAPSLTSSMAGTSTPAAAPASAGDAGLLAAATPAASSTSDATSAAPAASTTTPAAAATPASAPEAAAPLTAGMPAAPAPASAKPSSAATAANVSNWYKAVLGRDGDAAGVSYWQNAVNNSGDVNGAYNDFVKSAEANHEAVKVGTTLDQANAYGTPQPASPYQPVTIDNSQLATRTINQPTETVQGQLGTILAADNPVLQQARADGMRTAFDRGLGNSSIAASAGEDALIRAATGIATTDSQHYNDASNYNAAAENQALMYNAQAQNAYQAQTQQIDAQAAQQDKSLQSQASLQAQQLGQQMTLAQIQDATSRWNTEQQTANSRYNTDTSYKQSVDNQKLGVANNIIQNADLSPDRKAAMLEQLGFGTMAKDGTPGTGLAGAVYVLDSTSSDLNFGANRAQQAVNGVMSAIG